MIDNARRRWPGVAFRVEHAAVQGHDAARQVIEALAVLDRDPAVDVIIVSRGGGALEDLLPFSDEGLVRAVAACRTRSSARSATRRTSRCSTWSPTCAPPRRPTPPSASSPTSREELQKVVAARDRGRYVLRRPWSQREQHALTTMRSRPVLADPHRVFDQLSETRDAVLVERSRRTVEHRLDRAADDLDHRLARVRALSPLATLHRGYAVVQTADGDVVTSVADARARHPSTPGSPTAGSPPPSTTPIPTPEGPTMPDAQKTPAADDLSYEQARDELVAVVQKLEAGGTTLEESIALWERGEELAAICQRWLDGARARLDAVMTETADAAGNDD